MRILIKKITNKQESKEAIIRRNLNRIEEVEFNKKNINNLKECLDKTNYSYYNIRDKSSAMGKFLYKLTKEQVIEYSKNYEAFSVFESLCLADKYMVLQGEIFINDNFELMATLDDRKNIPNREAVKHPKYNLSLDLKEKREPFIRGLTEIIDYITKHELFNCYVEFSIFDIPVGIHKENIIIWELRNY